MILLKGNTKLSVALRAFFFFLSLFSLSGLYFQQEITCIIHSSLLAYYKLQNCALRVAKKFNANFNCYVVIQLEMSYLE